MSERTVIGGTSYETVGSSSANLLLKCNGTARIQWGNKLIDLIKNGKIASDNSSEQVLIISDTSEIKRDGIYIMNTDDSPQLLISKDGETYNLIGSDLYISASRKQDITAEQRKQALENIGMYFNTLDDVQSSGIKDGIVYVLEDNTLYVIRSGVISEFEAKLKTVTVEKENERGEVINSSIKIVLSILDQEYLILENKRITANCDVHVKTHAQLGSEGADSLTGYRLFIDGDTSRLEVDEITVRNGLPSQEYLEITFDKLMILYNNSQLKPHQWYLITDYQNPWRLPAKSEAFNRPILVRALTSGTFYVEGSLFKDRRVAIHFDPTYQKSIKGIIKNSKTTEFEESLTTRGLITWMRDNNGNEANFDFLDYANHENKTIVTLHKSIEDASLDDSIFPKNSVNNKIKVHNLCGVYLYNDYIDYDTSSKIDFAFDDSDDENPKFMEMNNNSIECRGFTLSDECAVFCNNVITNVVKLTIEADTFENNSILEGYNTVDPEYEISSVLEEDYDTFTNLTLDIPLKDVHIGGFINSEYKSKIINTTFKLLRGSIIDGVIDNSVFGDVIKSNIKGTISNSSFEDVNECTFYDSFKNVKFKNLDKCNFGTYYTKGMLETVTAYSDIFDYTFKKSDAKLDLLYDVTKNKDVYYTADNSNTYTLQIIVTREQTFARGMIIMYSGMIDPPTGWAVCDGRTVTFEGEEVTTPNLVGRFIKACGYTSDIGHVNVRNDGKSNEFKLSKSHLPEHHHQHKEHTHEISEIYGSIKSSGNLSLSGKYEDTFTTISSPNIKIAVDESDEGIEVITSVSSVPDESLRDVTISGGNHSHTLTVSGGAINPAVSEEDTQTWENEAFNLEPNYYSLIFIMKL